MTLFVITVFKLNANITTNYSSLFETIPYCARAGILRKTKILSFNMRYYSKAVFLLVIFCSLSHAAPYSC